MTSASRSLSYKLRLIVVVGTALIGLAGFSGLPGKYAGVSASRFGPSASHTNAPGEDNCTACHTSFDVNSGTGSVTISGIPTKYNPGQQINVTVTTSQSDAIVYGFQLTALDQAGHGMGAASIGQPVDPCTSGFSEYEGHSERSHQTSRMVPTVRSVSFGRAAVRAFRAGPPVALYAS